MKKFYNIHCHIITMDLMPPELYFKRYKIPDYIIESILEAIKYQTSLPYITEIIKICGGSNILNFLNLFNSSFDQQVEALLQTMDKCNIDIATPLMLDLELGCGKYNYIPYTEQIKMFSELPVKTNNRLLPFFMVDPRRENIVDLTIKALNLGFIGLKLYPPLGYNPNYLKNNSRINNNLFEIYKYCSKNNIPITSHCSTGGIRGDNGETNLAHPSHWYNVLWDFPNLKVNLAHFGGNSSFIDTFYYNKKDTWTYVISKMMMEFDNLFADVSFHDAAVDNKNYFKALTNASQDPFISGKILGGTDYPLDQTFYTENQVLDKYKKDETYNNIFSETPEYFLFGS